MPESDSGSSGDTEWKDGEIKIDEFDDYIKTHYPSYKFITKNESLRDSSFYYNQFNTSYYIQNICDADGNFIEGESKFSEGNCMLSAMYTVLSDWANCSLISDKIDFKSTANIIDTIKFDWLYDKYCDSPVMIKSGKGKGDEGDGTVYYKWGVNYNSNLRNMPVLYSNIREFAVCDYGYTPESGFKTSDVPQLLSAVANRYKVSINVSYTTLKAVALNSINEGKAVLLGINGSSSYHNHGVTIVGYQQYGLFKPIDSFNFVGQKHFFLVADNWHKESRYFDPNTDAKPALSYCILQNGGG